MKGLIPRILSFTGLSLCVASVPAKEANVIHFSCKLTPISEYNIRVDTKAEVMWVHGTRLKLRHSATEYMATEFSGEAKELKAEYRINLQSSVLRRTSYGLNGVIGTSEGACKKSDKPLPPKIKY